MVRRILSGQLRVAQAGGVSSAIRTRFSCADFERSLASRMSDSKFPYETRLDILHQPFEVIDIPKFAETVEFKCFNRARLTNTRSAPVGFSTNFGAYLRASQEAGVSSAIRLIGKFAKPGKIEER
jgi:hypothetical protein